MSDEQTCGTGLAAHAALPEILSELATAMANLLDGHQRALDLTDEQAKPEHHAYVTLVLEYRSLAAQLQHVAREMAGYASLPACRHDMTKMMSAEAAAVFAAYVDAERKLLAWLTDAVREGDEMLKAMG